MINGKEIKNNGKKEEKSKEEKETFVEGKSIDIRKREIFKLAGKSSVAIGTLALIESCVRKPQPEKLLPYLEVPETIIPGIPYYYATTCSGCPAGCGIVVKVEDAIPRKVEGNNENPISAGKTCARGQAIIHQLYSPDRIKKPRIKTGDKVEEIEIEKAIEILTEKIKSTDPKKIFFITENITGKTEKFYSDFAEKIGIPKENIIRWETFSFAPIRKASQIVFGKEGIPLFRIDKTDLIVSFSGDFLDAGPNTVLYSRLFGKFHSVDEEKNKKGKFIYISSRLNLTGLNADKWIEIKPGGELIFALALLNKIASQSNKPEAEKFKQPIPGKFEELTGVSPKVVEIIAEEILKSENPLIIPPFTSGDENATALCTISLLINYLIGTADKNIVPDYFNYTKLANQKDIKELAKKIQEQNVDILIISSYSPIFSAPEFTGLKSAIKNAPFVVQFSYHEDETSEYAHLIIPDYHSLEKWGDSEVAKGVITFYQPVISPLYKDARQKEDVLIQVANKIKEGSFTVSSFRDYLKAEYGLSDEEWVKYLEKGGIFNQGIPEPQGEIKIEPPEKINSEVKISIPERKGTALIIYPSYHLYDGRTANSPYIQEFFDPATKISWRNTLEINPKTAEKLGLKNGEIVKVSIGDKKIEIPVQIYNGIVEDAVAISCGRGHKNYGRFASGKGANPLEIIPEKFDESGEISFVAYGIEIEKTGKKLKRLPTNEGVPRQLSREVAHFTTLQALPNQSREEKIKELEKILKKRFPRGDWEKYGKDSAKPSKYRWKMVIDLDKCIGCSACMIACQIENNIPFVGESEVVRGREITWIRVERYWVSAEEIKEGKAKEHNGVKIGKLEKESFAPEAKKAIFFPMMCQHCEYAPCEYVCPVYATMHTSDGLNAQVYNRCVGTRFCANNCPYKVRYFNWHDYFKNIPEPLNMFFNPSVTVRSKGVMEKCTFCIQRIKQAEHNAKIEGRDIKDGEVIPACAQVCPTDAITFGNIKDEESQVKKAQKSKRINWALKDLGTEPSVTYLEKVFDIEIDEKFNET
jgi:molybdopterin-containing oxidoreductase family iron-sulfur binding subunit